MIRHCTCLWKMSATPGACIKPGLIRRSLSLKVNLPSFVARRRLCHKVNLPGCEVNLSSCVARRPLCHKVNLPRCDVNLSSCVARRPLCHKVNLPRCEVNLSICVARRPFCHKVNLPRCESRRRHLIMTCDIFGTGQTNTLTLCYLLGKTYKPAHSSATLESLKSTRSTKLLEKFS